MDRPREIVLLTGSNGFLGRHILKHLLEDEGVSEVRALDKRKSEEAASSDKIKRYNCDLLNVESCREAFRGADVVLHCAALVSYDYPPDVMELERNNVTATENVVKLCIEENVVRLVHCSTTEITLQPCFRGGIFAVSIFKQESKLQVPDNDGRLIFGEYAASKLKAEKIVLAANGAPLQNGKDSLLTVALRPTLLYGEGDSHLLPEIMRIAKSRGDYLLRLSGPGGKQQITYVGNAAWAFLRAKDTLLKTPTAIAGLPVTITDDTQVDDLMLFCERVTRSSAHHVKISSWSIPLGLSYLGAIVVELLSDIGLISKFKMPPCSIVAFLGSIVLYNRTRASIHMNYWPRYTNEQTLGVAAKYYGELCSAEKQ